MLIANDQDQKRITAWDAQKGQNYFCPECGNEVILRQGKIKIAHYAHKVESLCLYQTKETELHLRIKKEIYDDLSTHPDCYRCELERRLDGVRPDVSLFVGTSPVAIEIQRSDISIDTIVRRTMRYFELKINLLWILPQLAIDEDGICRVRSWHKFLHRMYQGRIYLWLKGANVKAVHLEDASYWINQYEDWETGQVYGGYEKVSTIRKQVISLVESVHIARDFSPVTRYQFNAENQYMPASRIWLDNSPYQGEF